MIAAFFVWEFFAPHPMVPRALFKKAKKTMIVILLITWLSGGNFFVLLLFWPTQIYNVYGKLWSRLLHAAHLLIVPQVMTQSALVFDHSLSDSASLLAQRSASFSSLSPKVAFGCCYCFSQP